MGKTAAAPETLELVSPHANLWISLTTNLDDYTGLGGMRTVKRGERIRFRGGRAVVSADLRDAVMQTNGYGRDFFVAEDPRAVLQRALGGPQVHAGQVLSRMPLASEEPPLPDWDTTGARGLRTAIENGEVTDLQAALMWETRPRAGKARAQVLDALGKALRAKHGDGEPEEETTPPATDPQDPPATDPQDPPDGDPQDPPDGDPQDPPDGDPQDPPDGGHQDPAAVTGAGEKDTSPDGSEGGTPPASDEGGL